MPTNKPTKKISSLRLIASLGLAALVTLTSLHAAPAAASPLDGSAQVVVNIVEREGYQQGVHALVFVRSRFLVPMQGDIALTVNGVLRKVEPVMTDSQTVIDIFLGPMDRPITACATFGGQFWLGGDNYVPTQANGCDHVALAPPPGFRAPSPRVNLVSREFRPSR